MLKKGIMLLILGLIFSSCDLLNYAIQDNIYRIERERERKELSKKDGPGAIVVDKYKEGVEEATKDIIKRSINKRVEFEGTILLIPENTNLNPKHGNIVDEKTGYGIAITFTLSSHCISKKVNNVTYSLFYNSKNNTDISRIAKEIMRVNGFNDTCKEREEATRDVSKRPINKRIEFEGISLTIPENTIINSKGDLVDMKTGSEMFITFSLESGCLSKTVNGKRCGLYYHELNDDVNKIAEKIIKINGFRNTCKY